MVAILLADGFETAEALVPLDLLRRAGIETKLYGLGSDMVTSSQGLIVKTDGFLDSIEPGKLSMLMLPGGPGVERLRDSGEARAFISEANRLEKLIAAICAAPVLLAEMGLLKGLRAVCFPDMSDKLEACGALYMQNEKTVRDGRFITGQAAGASVDFGLALIEALNGSEAAGVVRRAVYY